MTATTINTADAKQTAAAEKARLKDLRKCIDEFDLVGGQRYMALLVIRDKSTPKIRIKAMQAWLDAERLKHEMAAASNAN